MIENKSNLLKRLATGTLLIVTISALVLSGSSTFAGLLFVLNFLSLNEFYASLKSRITTVNKATGTLLSVFLIGSPMLVLLYGASPDLLLLTIPLSGLIFVAQIFQKSNYPLFAIALTFLGVIFITVPLLLFAFIPFIPSTMQSYNAQIAMGYFIILWTNDSGAYITGKLFGKSKLFKEVSPNKTWEGSIGGAAMTLLATCIIAENIKAQSLTHWLVTAIIIIISGTFGDLFKSKIKRSLHIKDMGSLLPGHGGFVDRFDSLFGSAPFVFIYLIYIHYR